jgi:hypothetical protein
MKARLAATLAAVLVAVAPASAASLFFDFGDSNQTTPGNYNNFIMNPPVTGSIANAIDSTGASTGIGATVSGFFNGSNTTGTATPTGAAAALFHPQATRDNAFGHAAAFGTNPLTPEGTVAFTGLDPSTAYNFTIFAARIGVTDIREAKYVVTGANSGMALLNASGNTSNLAVISGIFPTAGGTIDLKASPGPNNNSTSQFYFLGALELAAVPEPSAGLSAVVGVLGLLGRRLR